MGTMRLAIYLIVAAIPEPIVNLKTVKFPAKVYHGGQIQRMTRKEFESIM
ncbi:hypothetical protein EUAN_08660 [Andreesenia angusta]|uniref:Uncharacterized protein n=1 Tax=Andreesenia angusta TaxID=39480 RepID=A0A1S1V909_9FIRM|nr:hypothetical protein EUAN_08660 [Andreesenia angusta]